MTPAKQEAEREADRKRRPSQKLQLERKDEELAKANAKIKELYERIKEKDKQLREKDEQLEEKDNVLNTMAMSSRQKKNLIQQVRVMRQIGIEKRKVESRYEQQLRDLDDALNEIILEEEREGQK